MKLIIFIILDSNTINKQNVMKITNITYYMKYVNIMLLCRRKRNKVMDDMISMQNKWVILCKLIPSLNKYEKEDITLRRIATIENCLIRDYNISKVQLYNMYINDMMQKKYIK